MAEDPRAKYGLSCPSGGSFYICDATKTRFIGCCGDDPCSDENDGSCPDKKLHPASFSATNYIDIPGQDCVEPYNTSTWWTCQGASPPFMGCCKENPCNEGCSRADLLPARLSDIEDNAAPFLKSSSTPSPTNSDPDPTPAPAKSESPTGAIVGGAVGGLVLVFAVIGVFLWMKKRKEKARMAYNEDGVQSHPSQAQSPNGGNQAMMAGSQYSPYKDSFPSTAQSSPYPQSPPYPYQASMGMVSPPMSTVSTCWSPRTAGAGGHSRHISQLSELSGDGLVQELPPEGSGPQPGSGVRPVSSLQPGSGLQPLSKHPGFYQSATNRYAQTEGPPEGVGHMPEEGDIGRRNYHELDAGNR